MMKVNLPKRMFVEKDKDCTCDFKERKSSLESAKSHDETWVFDEKGNRLFYLDSSSGWRSRVPGECRSCYERILARLKTGAK
jgi:hypothetical protein